MQSRSRIIARLLDAWRQTVRRTRIASRGTQEETDARIAEGASRTAYHEALARDAAEDAAAVGDERGDSDVA